MGMVRLTLIFTVTALHLLMFSLLDLAFQDARPLGLVKSSDLEDLSRVQPRVGPAAHHGNALAHPATIKRSGMYNIIAHCAKADGHLIDRYPAVGSLRG